MPTANWTSTVPLEQHICSIHGAVNIFTFDISRLFDHYSRQETERLVHSLVGHISHGNTRGIYTHYRRLYMQKTFTVSSIAAYLFSQNWSEIRFKEQLDVFTGLLNLVNDLDEAQARDIQGYGGVHRGGGSTAEREQAEASFEGVQ